MDYFDVLFFVVAADVVGLARFAFGNDFVEGSCVVFYIEPVTDLITFSVHWERLALQGVEDHQRDQLFREVARAVVVAAVGDQRGQAIGAAPGSHQVVGAGFTGAVGATWGVGGLFGEQVRFRILRFAWMREVTVHFVCADVVKAEAGFLFAFLGLPVLTGSFQQRVGADDVGFDKLGRAVYGAVYMAFCCQVHDGVWLVLCQYAVNFSAIADVDLFEAIAFAVAHFRQAFEVASLGEFVEVDHFIGVVDDVANDCGANEVRAAGYE